MNDISADGTFRLVGQLENWSQVYMLSAIIEMPNGYFFYPVFFGILGRKDKPTYLRMLRWLKNNYSSIYNRNSNAAAPFEPTKVYSDFEQAFINGMSQVYPSAECKLCLGKLKFFSVSQCHLCQQ